MSTRTPRLEIRLADSVHVGSAARILEEASGWATSRGFAAWTVGHFAHPDGPGQSRLRQSQSASELYLAWLDGEAAATFTLAAEDSIFWPTAPPDALYLHRFAVRRRYAGVGARIVEWAAIEVRRRGLSYVRLDCLANSPRIRSYYERAGFEWREDVDVGGERFSLYERAVP